MLPVSYCPVRSGSGYTGRSIFPITCEVVYVDQDYPASTRCSVPPSPPGRCKGHLGDKILPVHPGSTKQWQAGVMAN